MTYAVDLHRTGAHHMPPRRTIRKTLTDIWHALAGETTAPHPGVSADSPLIAELPEVVEAEEAKPLDEKWRPVIEEPARIGDALAALSPPSHFDTSWLDFTGWWQTIEARHDDEQPALPAGTSVAA